MIYVPVMQCVSYTEVSVPMIDVVDCPGYVLGTSGKKGQAVLCVLYHAAGLEFDCCTYMRAHFVTS